MNPMMMAALEYEAMGLSIIPLKPRDKIPLVTSWTQFQKERAGREQIGKWWRTWKDANIGIITGSISRLLVIDADSQEAASELKSLLGDLSRVGIVTTSKGFHLYYRHSGKNLSNKARVQPRVDFRGDGGYVVAPPSVHNSGKVYEWAKPLRDDLPYLPAQFEKLLVDKAETTQGFKERFDTSGALQGLPEGQRDEGLFKLAAKLRGADVPYDIALELCEQAAANCNPPFKEAKRKVDQAYKYAPGHGSPMQPTFWPEPMTAKELIDFKPDPARWVWGECLPLKATSALVAKSYTGKTTFACSLALAVSRGIDFLGRQTQKGNVLYVYLDGPIDELRENFSRIGLSTFDSIFVYAGKKPDLALEWVDKQCVERAIKLLIVDTAQKFFGFKEDKYEEKINKMQPMLDLVNLHNFHAMFTYHAAKNSSDTISALGSVAAEANARVSLYLRRLADSEFRVFETQQNTGKRFETIGLSDPKEGFIVKIGTFEEVQVRAMTDQVLAVIKSNPGITETDVKNEIAGRGKIIGMALASLKSENKVEWTGSGKKGDARKYYLAGQLFKEETKAKVIDLFGKSNTD